MDQGIGITRGGPKRPVAATPPRAPGSLRRTSTVDSIRPDGPAGDVVVVARARDLHTLQKGEVVVDSAKFDAVISSGRILESLVHPDRRLQELVGVAVASGFRAKINAVLPDEALGLTPLHVLLDDLPGANLVAGYAVQRHPSWTKHRIPVAHLAAVSDLCAGWATGATILDTVGKTGSVPVPTSPSVPVDIDDPVGWHDRPSLPPGAMRRARRLDLVHDPSGAPTLAFEGHFRDSFWNADRREGAVHEYSVRGRFDPSDHTIAAIDATAHVLPWTECDQAMGSADRVVGLRTDELRARVRAEFIGTSTCTHLNDVLRSLADLPALAVPLLAI